MSYDTVGGFGFRLGESDVLLELLCIKGNKFCIFYAGMI